MDRAKARFAELVCCDVEEFNRHAEFVKNPKKCLLGALAIAETEAQTISEYQTRLMPLVYGNIKPVFSEAFRVFKTCSQILLDKL